MADKKKKNVKLPKNWKKLSLKKWLELFKDQKGEYFEHTFTNHLPHK